MQLGPAKRRTWLGSNWLISCSVAAAARPSAESGAKSRMRLAVSTCSHMAARRSRWAVRVLGLNLDQGGGGGGARGSTCTKVCGVCVGGVCSWG